MVRWYYEKCREVAVLKDVSYKMTFQSAPMRTIVKSYEEKVRQERRLFSRKNREQERQEHEEKSRIMRENFIEK